MRELVALAVPGGPAFVDALVRVWHEGDAALPLDLRLPRPARAQVLDALRPTVLVDEVGDVHHLAHGRPVDDGDALVVATSGTTGTPKGVVLTHAAVEASARATSARIGVRADDHWLACLPLSHVGGLSVVTRALTLGTRLTVLPGFDADAVADSPATLVSLVPTALARIDPARFRVIVLGGAAPPVDLPPNCVTTYGLTETGSGVVYDGVPLDGVEVRIGPSGTIHLRGPMLLRAYRDGTDPKDADGWLDTGDVGALDPHGRLSVRGRRDDLIVSGGENVWPDPIEAVLRALPEVADAAVGGAADPEWGQCVVAYVVPHDPAAPPTLAALRAAVKDVLPAYCAPRRLVLLTSVPRTALGKVRRHALPEARRDEATP